MSEAAVQEDEKKMVSAVFPTPLVHRLLELARANERSFSAELRVAVAAHVEREQVSE